MTQRVIKRQYIDPQTGQILEYDPNNELFANLPPETVFEEHTIISDDSSGNPPIIHTTTTTSKNASNRNLLLADQMHTMTLNDKAGGGDRVDNIATTGSTYLKQHDLIQPASIAAAAASFRIKSHPEDNQGYPEERNMDYDPMDDSYPDDDSPYEGLIHPPGRGIVDESEDATGGKHARRKTRRKDLDVNELNLGKLTLSLSVSLSFPFLDSLIRTI